MEMVFDLASDQVPGAGTVNAGGWIFSPPRLVIEQPRGDERQGLVVLPPAKARIRAPRTAAIPRI